MNWALNYEHFRLKLFELESLHQNRRPLGTPAGIQGARKFSAWLRFSVDMSAAMCSIFRRVISIQPPQQFRPRPR